jgi:hypothetical protein
MGRKNTEFFEIGRGLALTQGAVTRFSRELPVGEPWVKLHAVFSHLVVIGTGTGPKAQGGLRIARGVTFRTDKGEVIADNVPARFLYQNDQIKDGTPAALDAILASNGTYRANVNLWLVDPLSLHPADTILDTSRYNTLTLEILLGTIADLYTTPGTATVVTTLDLYVERLRGRMPQMPPGKGIRFHQHYGVKPAVSPSALTEISLDRAADLAYKRLHVWGEGVTTVAGIPFSGDADSAIVDDVTLDDGNSIHPFNRTLGRVLRGKNKQDYSQELEIAGLLVLDVMRDGSMNSALYSGNKSRLAVEWTNGAIPAAPQVSVAFDSFKPLRP